MNIYTCHKCGFWDRHYAPVQRHVDEEHRGGRIDVTNEAQS